MVKKAEITPILIEKELKPKTPDILLKVNMINLSQLSVVPLITSYYSRHYEDANDSYNFFLSTHCNEINKYLICSNIKRQNPKYVLLDTNSKYFTCIENNEQHENKLKFIEERRKEVHANYDFFQSIFNDMINEHRNEFVLIKNKEIKGYFSTFEEAEEEAKIVAPDNIYSIQEITDEIII